jgi:molybdopterin-guanine dinucleotide biosynthesis protein A
MGRTKALIEIDGVPMGARVADALRGAGCDPVVAYGGDPDELAPLGLSVLPDRHLRAGPLGGVLGLLEAVAADGDGGFGDALAVVVACDLPSLRADDLRPLVDTMRGDSRLELVMARTSQLEPACAVWRVAAHTRLRTLFDAGERALHGAFDTLPSTSVDVDAAALRNINAPDDLGRYP